MSARRWLALSLITFPALGTLACMGGAAGHGAHDHGSLPPAPALLPLPERDGVPALSSAKDESPDPALFETRLRAAPAPVEYLPGKAAMAWSYDGTVPGPLIEVDKGTRVRVHFQNDLPEATTIHWHGVRVPNAMDGAGHMAKPIAAGASFDYEFVAIDPGLFWFHPHVRADEQVEKGLYGVLLVRDPGEPKLASREVVLVLDDVRLDPATGLPELQADSRAAMMGREGNLILVNGKPANGSVEVQPGERVRLRLVNTANSRYFALGLRGGGKLVQVGGDGGLLPAPRALDGLLLVPGERADVLVEVPATAGGAPLVLEAQPYERAIGARPTAALDLVRFVPKGDAGPVLPALPAQLRPIEPLPTPPITRQIRLDERMGHHAWEFTINGKTFPAVPPLMARAGTRELWIVENKSTMDHPFHLHGFFFQVDGVPAWKDTVNVPGRKTVRLAVDIDARDGAAGAWMYHCHILEHAEAGMLAELHVE